MNIPGYVPVGAGYTGGSDPPNFTTKGSAYVRTPGTATRRPSYESTLHEVPRYPSRSHDFGYQEIYEIGLQRRITEHVGSF